MGEVLSKPVTDKLAMFDQHNEAMYVAGCGMQGWRLTMEDAHVSHLALEGAPDYAFFGVYDGHCGKAVAHAAADGLHKRLSRDHLARGEFDTAFRDAFLGFDLDLKHHPEVQSEGSGSTAITCLIGPASVSPDGARGERVIVCGNCGDSRAVLSRGGVAVDLSTDHKPNLDAETARITKAGSYVMANRVNGNLALSRALGDFSFKKAEGLSQEEQAVTARPEVRVEPLRAEDEFVILACDGVWDMLSSQEAVSFVRDELLRASEAAAAAAATAEAGAAP